MKQTSPEKRLIQLFQRYNQLYWSGKLPEYRIGTASDLGGLLGQCDARTRTIQIDVAKHKSARELRSTLLHEMCHLAADRKGSRGHDAKFFEQLEQLLRKKAPISIADPEAGMATVQSELVPAQFPLLKRKMGRITAKQRKPLQRFIKVKKLRVRDISDEDIIREFEYHAWESEGGTELSQEDSVRSDLLPGSPRGGSRTSLSVRTRPHRQQANGDSWRRRPRVLLRARLRTRVCGENGCSHSDVSHRD
jgi:hypothetical protein